MDLSQTSGAVLRATSTLVNRRSLFALGAGLGAAALVGCGTSSGTSTTATAAAKAATTGSTNLGPGTYLATFASSGGGAAAPGGAAPSAGGTPPGAPPSGGMAPSGAASGNASGSTSAGTLLSGACFVDGIEATIDGGTWQSTTADQNVFLVVNGGKLTITNATIVKSGDSSNEEACNFVGLNSAVLAVGQGSSVQISNCQVTTAAEGSNALFAADSATLSAATVTIRTSKNSSRGLDATYAGVIKADSVDIATTGAHCACIATDRGNGTITVTGATTLSSAGDGSPLIYCTGDISVTGATGTATGAQTMVIEGKNTITLDGCTFTTTGTEGMMIYQSASGDAADSAATSSKATMTIANSTITSSNASEPMIYVTNTTCDVNVTASSLSHPGGTRLMDLQEDRWGTSGSNGGHATATFSGCTLTGDIAAGSSSSATVTLANGSTLSGATSGPVTLTDA